MTLELGHYDLPLRQPHDLGHLRQGQLTVTVENHRQCRLGVLHVLQRLAGGQFAAKQQGALAGRVGLHVVVLEVDDQSGARVLLERGRQVPLRGVVRGPLPGHDVGAHVVGVEVTLLLSLGLGADHVQPVLAVVLEPVHDCAAGPAVAVALTGQLDDVAVHQVAGQRLVRLAVLGVADRGPEVGVVDRLALVGLDVLVVQVVQLLAQRRGRLGVTLGGCLQRQELVSYVTHLEQAANLHSLRLGDRRRNVLATGLRDELAVHDDRDPSRFAGSDDARCRSPCREVGVLVAAEAPSRSVDLASDTTRPQPHASRTEGPAVALDAHLGPN